MTTCSECARPVLARGYCNTHYRRWQRAGTPADPARPSLRDRFMAKVVIPEDPDACWGWAGSKDKGYGRVWVDGRPVQAQRVSYELFVGPIPEDYEVDHLCRNPECTHPRHLEAVTKAENIRRMAAAWIRCRKGHEFTPDNTVITSSGRRRCRICKNDWQRPWHQARRVSQGAPAASGTTHPERTTHHGE